MLTMPNRQPLGQFAIVSASHLWSEQRQFEEGYLTNPEPSLHPVAHATKGEPVTLTLAGQSDFSLNIRPHTKSRTDFFLNPQRIR